MQPRRALVGLLLLLSSWAGPQASLAADDPPAPPPAPPVPGPNEPRPPPAPAPRPGPDDAPPGPDAPAQKGPALGTPSLVADRAEHDFGVAAQNQTLLAEFTLKNVGSEPVRITKPLTDCGCYAATLSAQELAPGAEVQLKISFHTLTWSGSLVKKLRVLSSDPVRGELVIPLKVNIVAGVILDPGRFSFGDLLRGEAPSKSLVIKWYEGVGKPFQVVEVLVPQAPDAFEVATEPYESERWKGTRVTLRFRSPPALGMFSAVALLRTDAPGFERLEVPVQAFVSGLVWVQETKIDMGWVRAGQTKTKRVAVRPFRKGIELGKVGARAREGRVQVEVVADAPEKPGAWWLVVVVPASAPKGPVNDVIELTTEVKGEEVTLLHVSAEVIG